MPPYTRQACIAAIPCQLTLGELYNLAGALGTYLEKRYVTGIMT